MSLIYDENIFRFFRGKAITDVAQLEIGKEYYTNNYPEKFKLLEIISMKEAYRRSGLLDNDLNDTEPRALSVMDNRGNINTKYLHDSNIGDSYNPWLIFSDEETAKDCQQKLVVEYKDDMDHYYYGNEDLYGDIDYDISM